MTMYHHMLFATDLTDVGDQISPKIMQLRDTFGAKLSLIHTIEPIPAYGYPGITDLESPIIEHAKEAMRQLAGRLQVQNDDCYIEFGSVKTQVLLKAKDLNSDLLLVGSHGRHGLARLLGSSASAIVNGAESDVLVLRVNG